MHPALGRLAASVSRGNSVPLYVGRWTTDTVRRLIELDLKAKTDHHLVEIRLRGVRLVRGLYHRRLRGRDHKSVQNAVRTIKDFQNPIAQRAAEFALWRWLRHKLDTAEKCPALITSNV